MRELQSSLGVGEFLFSGSRLDEWLLHDANRLALISRTPLRGRRIVDRPCLRCEDRGTACAVTSWQSIVISTVSHHSTAIKEVA